jgi:DnaJ-class molecular chaperone
MNIYETLGLHSKATTKEIKQAYANLSKFHTERNGLGLDHGMKVYYADLTRAYKILINEESRQLYDEYLNYHLIIEGGYNERSYALGDDTEEFKFEEPKKSTED